MVKILASLRGSRSADSVGAAGVTFGIVLVALVWILEEGAVGIDAATRTVGGTLPSREVLRED